MSVSDMVAEAKVRSSKKRVNGGRRRKAVQQRSDNRRDELLTAAARLFSSRGFEATSMRDIAHEVGMLAGSMYYHFPAKDDLILAAHAEGVRELGEAFDAAVSSSNDEWEQLEAACVAHLEKLLGGSPVAGVVAIDFSQLSSSLEKRLLSQRGEYEQRFAQLIAKLPLEKGVDRRLLRMTLLGALNWAPTWYAPGGGDTPAKIAEHTVRLLRDASRLD